MILGFILGFVLTFLIGYFSISIISREMELRFRLLLAIPLGFLINSLTYFLYLCFNFNHFEYYKLFELILTAITAILYFNEEKPDLSKHKFKKLSNWFYLLNLYAVLIFLKYFINNPMGSWDGFRIWNIKAAFLIQNSPLWKGVFELPHFMSHNDYPMFLPSITARMWNFVGGQNFSVNVTLGLIFTFGLVYLLFQAITYFKSEKVAIAAASIFMICDIFLVNGAAQCADIPIAYFFLSAILCLFLYFKKEQFPYIILGTIFAGGSLWVKNEGIMFFLVYTLTIFGYFLFKKLFKKSLLILLAAIPFILIAVLFKKLVNFPNDLVHGFFLMNTWKFALDTNRYIVIFKTFVEMLFSRFYILFLLIPLCIKGFKIKQQNRTPFLLSLLIFVLMCLGYFTVYLISPHDINWLVENSMDRIILQILPVFIFLFTLNLRIGKPDTLN